MIELIVAVAIIAIALVFATIGLGRISSAHTRESAGKLATAVRYAYHLAAVNNRTYALVLDLDGGTFHASPVQEQGECDRLLLHLDGEDDEGPLVTKAGETGDEEDKDKDDDEKPGDFSAIAEGGEPSSAGAQDEAAHDEVDDTSAAGKLLRMTSSDARRAGQEEARKAGVQVDDDEAEADALGKKKVKSFARNLLEKPTKLEADTKITGVVVREGGEPITSGEVKLLVYPHGYVQRALIYVESVGGSGTPEQFTVEVLSLQARGVLHEGKLDARRFKEEVE